MLPPLVALVLSLEPDGADVDGLALGAEEPDDGVAGLDAPGLDDVPPPAPEGDWARVTAGTPIRSTARARITTRCTCFI